MKQGPKRTQARPPSDDLKKSAIKGGAVVGAATCIQFALAFATQVSLARILEPALFGEFAFTMMLVMFCYNAINTHSDKFIIQKQIETSSEINSLITFEFILSIIVCGVLALFSSQILQIVERQESSDTAIALLALIPILVLARTKCLHDKNLDFIKARAPGLIAQVVAGISGIVAAIGGLGIWSLVIWRLSESLVEAILLNPFNRVKVKHLSFPIVRSLIRFSYPLTLSSFLVFLYYNMDRFIIDLVTENPNTQLGYYFLASQLANYFLKTRQILVSVLFPVFSKESSSKKKNEAFTAITKFMGFVMIIPACISYFWAEGILLLVFGEKWIPAAIPLQVMFSIVALRGINANATYLLHSAGITKADLVAASLFCLILAPTGYYFTLKWGITGMALAILATNIVTNYVTFSCFIKPIVRKGFFTFFLRPTMICAIVYTISHAVAHQNLGIKLIAFILALILAIATFHKSLAPVIHQLRKRNQTVR